MMPITPPTLMLFPNLRLTDGLRNATGVSLSQLVAQFNLIRGSEVDVEEHDRDDKARQENQAVGPEWREQLNQLIEDRPFRLSIPVQAYREGEKTYDCREDEGQLVTGLDREIRRINPDGEAKRTDCCDTAQGEYSHEPYTDWCLHNHFYLVVLIFHERSSSLIPVG